MSRTEPDSAPRTAPAADGGRPLRRVVLAAGAAVTAVGALSLLVVLVGYFLSWPSSPVLFGIALFGLPVGFVLLMLHLVMAAVARSRF